LPAFLRTVHSCLGVCVTGQPSVTFRWTTYNFVIICSFEPNSVQTACYINQRFVSSGVQGGYTPCFIKKTTPFIILHNS